MRPIVFAGPSLYRIDRRLASHCDLAPPARCGDILHAVKDGRETIALIDGTFETHPAVWHKEVLYALMRGCVVMGAASIGALRAAELADFGMLGIGNIFEDYRSGHRTSDADVALIHGPAELGYPPLSIALVDAEFAIDAMCRSGVIANQIAGALLQAARGMFFKARTWPALFMHIDASEADRRAIGEWLAANSRGAKARDACLLLDALKRDPAPTGGRKFVFRETRFFAALEQRARR